MQNLFINVLHNADDCTEAESVMFTKDSLQITRQPIPCSLARAGRDHSSSPTFPILAPDTRDPCDRPRAHLFSFRRLVQIFRASSSSSPDGVRISPVSSLRHIAS